MKHGANTDGVRVEFLRACAYLAVILANTLVAVGQSPEGHLEIAEHELSADQAAAINYAYGGGGYDYRECDHARAGYAQHVRSHAIPANTRHYGGYYGGGGVPYLGEGPSRTEGIYGWDYCGLLLPKRVALNWTHGRRYQGGGGAYKTDGPKVRH